MKNDRTLKEMIYRQITDGIVCGEYKGGQILTEKELSEHYDVSKAPVREALLILSSEGILKNIPRYGYQVVSFTLEQVADLMEFRSVVEDYILVRGFSLVSAEDIAALRALVAPDAGEDTDMWRHWEINARFHLRLAAVARNEYMSRQLEIALHLLKLAYAQFYWSQWNSASIPNDLKNHGGIVQAIEDKDLETARLYLKRDLKDFCMR